MGILCRKEMRMQNGGEEYLMSFLPRRLSDELRRLLASHVGMLSELRVRLGASSIAIIGGERIKLLTSLAPGDLEECFVALCRGEVFAKRDNIGEGFIPLGHGIRVGICGQARFDGGVHVGTSDISSLVFRLPSDPSCHSEKLLFAFSRASRGMLVFSPPGVGKTSALRSLAVGLAAMGETVVVVDERQEFSAETLGDGRVDVLSGYKKSIGMEIALRSLSPSVIIADEIGGSDEADLMLSALSGGIRVAASVHAGSFSELSEKPSLVPFLTHSVFDVFFGIQKRGGRAEIYGAHGERIDI